MEALLTLRDVSRVLSVSVRKVQKDLSAGRFGPPIVRLGRSVRVRQSDLELWMRQGCPSADHFAAMLNEPTGVTR